MVFNLLITGLLVVLLLIADRPALALFLGGDSPALPIARHIQLLATWSFLLFGVTLVLFGTVRANGAVIGPLIILFIGLFPVRLGFALGAYPLARRGRAVAELPGQLVRQHGAGDRLLPARRLAQGADGTPPAAGGERSRRREADCRARRAAQSGRLSSGRRR